MIVGRVLRELAVGVQSLQSWGAWGRIRNMMHIMGQARLAFRRLGGPAEPHVMVSVFRCTVPSASSGSAAAWIVLHFDLLAVLGSQQQHRRRALAT